MFYSDDPEEYFSGGSEFVSTDEYGSFESGGTETIPVSDPGWEEGNDVNGGFIDDIAGIASGESGGGLEHVGKDDMFGQSEEEKEEDFLVEQAEEDDSLKDALMNVLHSVAGIVENESDNDTEGNDVKEEVASEKESSSVYDIDDIYQSLETIKEEIILVKEDNLAFHKGNDIIGRVGLGLLGMMLGGIIVYAFLGRIR